jgi:hypothetical protein
MAAASLEHDTGYGRVLLPVLKIHLTIGFGGEDYLTLTRWVICGLILRFSLCLKLAKNGATCCRVRDHDAVAKNGSGLLA